MIEYPWPESPERTEARVSGLVASVLDPGELRSLRLAWVTPWAHHSDEPDAAWVALRLTVVGIDDEMYEQEIWGPGWPVTWEEQLWSVASDLEDWVCETSFAWGQQRVARVPD